MTVVDGLVHDKDHALIWFRNNVDENAGQEDLRIVDITTGRYGRPESTFPGRVLRWITDLSGTARLAVVYRKGSAGKEDFYYRDAAGGEWQRIELPNISGRDIYGFSPDGEHLYVSAYRDKNTSSLCLFDLKKGEISEEVFNDPKFDFDGQLLFLGNPHFSRDVRLKGISTQGRTVWFDSSMASIQRDLDQRLRETKNVVIDSDTSLTKFLVASYSDVQPVQYSVLDTRKHEILLVAESMPWIKATRFCHMREMSLITRDSLRLFGYLTYPNSGKPPFPTVVLLHGGPTARDIWGFNPEVQLLATNGYAVLQLNYRGSSGYGQRVSESNQFSYFEMHQDVSDATVRAIHSGIIDSNHVAIMGTSFGGYLAICGAAFEPGLYSCAITNAGVFDWQLQWDHFKDFANSRYYDEMHQLVSSKSNMSEFFKKASPMNEAQQIRIPVLIAGGRDDSRVPITQSYRLARKMRRSGNRPETYFRFNETHGFHYEANRVRYYGMVLDFLDRHMKGSATSSK